MSDEIQVSCRGMTREMHGERWRGVHAWERDVRIEDFKFKKEKLEKKTIKIIF